MDIEKFKVIVWRYYREHGRHDLLWRKTKDPYKILVSEIMLQQTQVTRVIQKYKNWMKKFPNIRILAKANARNILTEWQGLGYNRRALYLKKIAEKTILPSDFDELKKLPGVGQSTAGAIMAFAHNVPVVFIETNIRSVFIHHFFKDSGKISDEKILPLIEKTLDKKNPREWYYALMDYGVYLKSIHPNPSRKSSHHTKQSRFNGSKRQLRANILRELLKKPQTEKEIDASFMNAKYNTKEILLSLLKEGFVVRKSGRYRIDE